MERQLTLELSCPQKNRTESEDTGGASRHENVAANDEDNFNPFRIEVNQETAMVRNRTPGGVGGKNRGGKSSPLPTRLSEINNPESETESFPEPGCSK